MRQPQTPIHFNKESQTVRTRGTILAGLKGALGSFYRTIPSDITDCNFYNTFHLINLLTEDRVSSLTKEKP